MDASLSVARSKVDWDFNQAGSTEKRECPLPSNDAMIKIHTRMFVDSGKA
jgi:hypothetical protein